MKGLPANHQIIYFPERGFGPKSLHEMFEADDPEEFVYTEYTTCWRCDEQFTFHAISDVTWQPSLARRNKEVAEAKCPNCQAKVSVGRPRTILG